MNPEPEKLPFDVRAVFFKWSGRLLLVAIPALVTSYFSFLSAKEESEVKNVATKASAEAGYVALVAAVDKLQAQQRASELLIAHIEGQLSSLSLTLPQRPARHPQPLHSSGSGSGTINLGAGAAGLGAGASGRNGPGGGAGVSGGVVGGVVNGGRDAGVPIPVDENTVKPLPAPLPRSLDQAKQMQFSK